MSRCQQFKWSSPVIDTFHTNINHTKILTIFIRCQSKTSDAESTSQFWGGSYQYSISKNYTIHPKITPSAGHCGEDFPTFLLETSTIIPSVFTLRPWTSRRCFRKCCATADQPFATKACRKAFSGFPVNVTTSTGCVVWRVPDAPWYGIFTYTYTFALYKSMGFHVSKYSIHGAARIARKWLFRRCKSIGVFWGWILPQQQL